MILDFIIGFGVIGALVIGYTLWVRYAGKDKVTGRFSQSEINERVKKIEEHDRQ